MSETPSRTRGLKRVNVPWSRRATLASVPILLVVLIGLILPEVVEYDYRSTSLEDRLLPPGSKTSTGIAWVGTDQLGRDVLAQIGQGARVSVTVGGLALLLGGSVGAILGMIAGYVGGWLDIVVMRLVDMQLTLPGIILAILLASVIGPSTTNVVIVVALVIWGTFARVARASTLSLRERDFVNAAKVMQTPRRRILWRHILPGLRSSLLVVGTLEFGLAILLEASLSFLGLGTPPSSPSWGHTIAEGRDYLDTGWWISTMPGLVLAGLMVSVGLLGDELRDLHDPQSGVRTRGRAATDA